MKRLIIIFLLLSPGAHYARADYIGNIGAVNQTASGEEPKGKMHPLSLGDKIVSNERIQTGNHGNAQIIFLDTSTMTIGKNAEITIDKFLYSTENQDISTQKLSLARGVLRFIGGSVSHTSGSVIRTPSAIIGVRGGAALVSVNADNSNTIVLHYGSVNVRTSIEEKTIARPGLAVTVTKDGNISDVFRVSSDTIYKLNKGLASATTQNGGAKRPPQDTDVNHALASLPTLNVIQGNGLNQIGQIWAGNALVQSFANAINQYNAATQFDILSQVQAGQSNPDPGPKPDPGPSPAPEPPTPPSPPGPGPGPTPPPVPPTPPTPPAPPAPPNPPGPVNLLSQ